MKEYSVIVRILYYRQYEITAENEKEARQKAAKRAKEDSPSDASNVIDEISLRGEK